MIFVMPSVSPIRLAALVEKEQHNPIFILCDIAMCKLTYTFAVDGLSENDFILTAKSMPKR
ncbi:MAG TPA: hypothetical protein DEB70_08900 [Planctomycetaceae bacterium]|nr:hypothetical protein [Planctomycetaceae bacterium]